MRRLPASHSGAETRCIDRHRGPLHTVALPGPFRTSCSLPHQSSGKPAGRCGEFRGESLRRGFVGRCHQWNRPDSPGPVVRGTTEEIRSLVPELDVPVGLAEEILPGGVLLIRQMQPDQGIQIGFFRPADEMHSRLSRQLTSFPDVAVDTGADKVVPFVSSAS